MEHGELGEISCNKPGGPTRMVTTGETVGYILKVEPTSFADGLI